MKILINGVSRVVKIKVKIKVNIISPEWQRYEELRYVNEKK